MVRETEDRQAGIESFNWKRHDLHFPLAIARRAGELIPAAHLVVLPGYGHAPHEQNKDSFNRHLLDFLDHEAPPA